VRHGDVVVTAPVRTANDMAVGRIALFHRPGMPGEMIAHRIVGRTDSGDVVTRGDANATNDSTPVRPAAVVGLVRLRVPAIGLPVLWLREWRLAPLIGWAALTVAAATVTFGRRRSSHAIPASGAALVPEIVRS
jgi:signal peptidase